MTRARPTILLVTAVVNFVLGGLAILGSVCGSLALVVTANLSFPAPPGSGGVSKPMPNIMTVMEKHLPGYQAVVFGSMALNLLLALALVIGSLGVLRLRPWGRWTCVAVAVLGALAQVAGTAYNIRYVNPLMPEYQRELEEWQRQLMPKGPAAGPQIQVPSLSMNPAVTKVLSLIAPTLVTGYALFLVVVMFLPGVRAAFAGAELPPAVLPAEDRG
jgi:hypothetical protein